LLGTGSLEVDGLHELVETRAHGQHRQGRNKTIPGITFSKNGNPRQEVSESSDDSCLMDAYPKKIVLASVIQTFVSYALGAAILYLVGPIYSLGFIFLVGVSMVMSPIFRCRYCYYHGKRCNFGLGIVAGIISERGPGDKFRQPRYVYPTAAVGLAVMILPLATLAYLLVTDFTLAIVVTAVLYILTALAPGFYLRPRVFCYHCIQGRMGCPAYDNMKKGEGKEEPA
jgi:hypothetical protein